MQPIFTKHSYRKYLGLQQAAHKLRKQQTPYEEKLWQRIMRKKLLNVRFHRQQILLNSYIVDFYAPAIKLAIELDGSQHNLKEHKENDVIRDNKLNSKGIAVKRYSNIMINREIDAVIKDLHNCIWQRLKELPSLKKHEL